MNAAQRLQLERVKLASFNDFDGEKVAKSLEENENFWISFVFGRFVYGTLIELRDLSDNHINGDEMYLLTTIDKIKEIEKLVEDWEVNEVGYITWNEENWVGTPSSFRPYDKFVNAYGAGLEGNQVVFRFWWD